MSIKLEKYTKQAIEARAEVRKTPEIAKVLEINGGLQDTGKIEAYSPDTLIKIAGQLAVLMMTLSTRLSEAELNYETAKNQRKLRHAKTVLEIKALGKTVAEAEQTAVIETQEWRQIESEAMFIFKDLKYIRDDTERIVSLCQTRISYLRSEQYEKTLQDEVSQRDPG